MATEEAPLLLKLRADMKTAMRAKDTNRYELCPQFVSITSKTMFLHLF
jgi:hypothetical protein